jgi:hypothetical protein
MNSEEQKIEAISRKIVEIELRKDGDALAPYITDDYADIDPSGKLIDKDISVGRYRRDDFHLSEHGVSDISVSVIDDTALEIGVMALKGIWAASNSAAGTSIPIYGSKHRPDGKSEPRS